MSERIVAYVDGFNLYHGLHAARGRRDLWLDLESLLRSMLDPARGQSLHAVHYFTAQVTGPGAARQQTYLEALVEHGACTTVWLGRFQRKHRRCADCGARWVVHEVRRIAPGVRRVAVFPPRRTSVDLERAVDGTLRIFDRLPSRHQLPDVVTTGDGRHLQRPAYWSA